MKRLTFDPGLDQAPLWLPDSRRLLFSSALAGGQNVYVQSADGTGSATRLTVSPHAQFATSITPDGTRAILFEATPTQGRDLRLLTLMPTPQVEPLVETRFDERAGVVSPNGRWLAFESNHSSGRHEVYVRPFPAVGDGLWQISTGGGVQPLWAPRGQELFYMAPDGALMKVSVDARSASWSAGPPARLLEGRYFTGAGSVLRHYDVAADGQRFLMIKDNRLNADAAQIMVVQNWVEELKSKVPTK